MTVLETVYRDYKDKIFGFLLHKLNNPTVAEDLCSDVFVKIAENIDRYNPAKSSLSTWVYNITRNRLFDYFRTNHVHSELDEETPADDDFVEKICTDEMLSRLADTLVALPEREREIVVRRYYNGETLKDIAERLDVSYSYVRILHQSALDKMKDFLQIGSALSIPFV